jgi:hypothetical protein
MLLIEGGGRELVMGLQSDGRTIVWEAALCAAPAEVYQMLASPTGRRRFWAASAEEADGAIAFQFTNGQTLTGRILERQPPARFALSYFGNSQVASILRPMGREAPIFSSPRPEFPRV